jgi:hypothetical protein
VHSRRLNALKLTAALEFHFSLELSCAITEATKIAQATPERSVRASVAQRWDVSSARIERLDARRPELEQLDAAKMIKETETA